MRESALSNLEQRFVILALNDKRRFDGRAFDEHRDLKILFGSDYGCCSVDLGKTKVMCQVSAEMEQPKESRASEGSIAINVEISTLAASHCDPTKPGELGIEIQRILEKSIILSQAVDLEELCIRVGERSWGIHVYIHVLCHDGNILDCASIAALTALKHFKRPCASVDGQEVVIHSWEEKNPLPLTIHHMPFCTTFAFFKENQCLLLDPSGEEERLMDGKLMISMNKHREICCLQMGGQLEISKKQILQNTGIAFEKIKQISEFVGFALYQDTKCKKDGKNSSSLFSIWSSDDHNLQKTQQEILTLNKQPPEAIVTEKLSNVQLEADDTKTKGWLAEQDQSTPIGDGVLNSWS